ncbi:MAG TPA: cytochrome c3 family protein [Anaeromyxobacteraceae bacterium]|nr:cytochrome c3 family protein [Anaeromyxobacteraceae bacterium]
MPLRSAWSLDRLATAARVAAALAVAVAATVAAPAVAAGSNVPLPPPPVVNGVALPLSAQAAQPAPAAVQAAPPTSGERCTNCHLAMTRRRFSHPALAKNECTACHQPSASEVGMCKSKTASKWALVKGEPDLCYGCHKRKDQTKSVHTAVRQGSCLSCHDPHGSEFPKQLTSAREKICFDCHELEPLLSKPVRHAPVADGRCLDCHDAHGSDQPNAVVGAGAAFCQKCHDAKAPGGKGAAGAGYRIDLTKSVVHKPISQKNDCGLCHEIGHSGDNLKLVKKNVVDLCYGCHERQDKAKFPHSAIVAGDCAVCHDPHSSNQPKLVARDTSAGTCFLCHQDDLTGRKVIHKPVEKGCDQCHIPHGGGNRNLLKGGTGKAVCYTCHQTPVDSGKVKHAAIERYGCTVCHDPHGTANRFLVAKSVNDLCAGCHPEQKTGAHVTPMLAKGHVIANGLIDPRKPDRPFTCASCHNPHGSDNPKFFYYGASSMQSCDGCHGDKSGTRPDLKNVVGRAKPKKVEPTGSAGGGGAGSGGAGSGGAGSGGSGSGSGGSGSGSGAGSGAGSGDDAPPYLGDDPNAPYGAGYR